MSIIFILYKSDKNFSQEDQVKTFMKILSLLTAEFYLRRVSMLPDKWQKVIKNNDKYAIDWHWFKIMTNILLIDIDC